MCELSGVMFNVTLGLGLLQMYLGMPETHQSDTIGLLGNFNSDKTDDFLPRYAATALSDTINERQIFHDFGQTCKFSTFYFKIVFIKVYNFLFV